MFLIFSKTAFGKHKYLWISRKETCMRNEPLIAKGSIITTVLSLSSDKGCMLTDNSREVKWSFFFGFPVSNFQDKKAVEREKVQYPFCERSEPLPAG